MQNALFNLLSVINIKYSCNSIVSALSENMAEEMPERHGLVHYRVIGNAEASAVSAFPFCRFFFWSVSLKCSGITASAACWTFSKEVKTN